MFQYDPWQVNAFAIDRWSPVSVDACRQRIVIAQASEKTVPVVRVGYAPYATDLSAPGDRRRFVSYAKARGVDFEIARPGEIYDLVVVSGLADFTYWSRYPHGKIIFDLIDSYLTEGRNLKSRLRGTVKFLSGLHRRLELSYRETLRAMCRRADAVICAVEEQRLEVRRYSENVHLILDVHSTVLRKRKTDYGASSPFKIGWEGLTGNLAQLETIRNTLNALGKLRPIELHIVTDPTMPRYFHKVGRIDTQSVVDRYFENATVHAWSEETCASVLTRCDLAVIPIDLHDSFAAGKPENKLVLLWKLGLPVITSATPAYRRAMAAAGLNHVCCSAEEWRAALLAMMQSEDLRRENGLRGHEHAMREYSDSSIYARWDDVLRSLDVGVFA
jgi:glycosyltransferase involved in cell wall biosynthesis